MSMTGSEFSKLRLLVHMHVYHTQHYPELKECLKNLEGLNYDLYVSFSEDHPDIEEDIRKFKPDAVIFKCPNRGYDVAPFLDVLRRVNLEDYDLVIKLHTKRDTPVKEKLINLNIHYKWREHLLSFISNQDNLHKTLKAFIDRPELGMAANFKLLLTENGHRHAKRQESLFLQAIDFMTNKLKVVPIPADRCRYVGGTMFMARAELFAPIKQANLGYEDFAVTDVNNKDEHDLAHLFERVFGWLVTSQQCGDRGNYLIDDPFSNRIQKSLWPYLRIADRFYRKLVKFVYRRNGDSIRIFKVFKIKL